MQTACVDFKNATSPYHQITHAGLNALIQEYFVHIKDIVLAVSWCFSWYSVVCWTYLGTSGRGSCFVLKVVTSEGNRSNHKALNYLQAPSQANLTNAPAYDYVLSLGQFDVEGGLVLLSDVYFNQLLNNYQ